MSETRKILVINGSPKKGASLTLRVTKAFVEGMLRTGGLEAEYVNVSDMNIKPCTGCLCCWGSTGGKCVLRGDDMEAFREKLLGSDFVIESFPIYFFGMPGPMKTMTDRLLGVMCSLYGRESGEDYDIRHAMQFPKLGEKLAVITSCGFSDSAEVFEPVRSQFDLVFGKGNYTSFCCPQLKALADKGSGQRFEKLLAGFADAGEQFARTGSVDAETAERLSKAPFSARTYRVLMESFWNKKKAGDRDD